jgi:TolB-like protein
MQNAECSTKKESKMHKNGSNIFLHSAFCILTSAFILSLTGCEVPGVLLHIAMGEPAIPAQYEPPKGKTLVLVENYRSPDEMQLDGDQIANDVTVELKKEGKLEVVNPEDDAAKFRAMNIQQVGKALDAKQVIYVDLLESAVTKDPSEGAVHGVAKARVKVIDVETGNTLWPSDASDGKELSQTAEFDPADSTHAMAIHTQMLANLSSKIAKLFYSWKPDTQDQENSGG